MNQLQTIQTQSPSALHSFNSEQVGLIKSTIAVGATDDELKLFLHHASRAGLDPLAKQIYFQKRQGKMVIITGIDGLRLIAERTGKYAGNDDPVFDDESNPKKATVTIWKIMNGIRCPFAASARWEQYYPGDAQGFMWKKMPHLMLGKCAEALALRKAFPAELSGIYGEEEMHQADKPLEASQAKQSAAQVANQRLVAPTIPAEFEEVEEALGDDIPSQNTLPPNADCTVDFGKAASEGGDNGKRYADISLDSHLGKIKWFVDQEGRTGKPTTGKAKKYLEQVAPYIRHFRPDADLPF